MEVEDLEQEEEAKHVEEDYQGGGYEVERGQQNRVTNSLA